MSTIKVNTVTKRTGSTLTLGESGTTVTLACGATQSGFGRSGSVNWCSTIYTNSPGTVTATSGKGFFLNTTSGAITINLPSSPSVGDIVAIKDYANTFDSNSVTVGRGGSKLGGLCIDATLGTEGWKTVQDSTSNVVGNPFLVATGGTITEDGNFKIHTFTGPGTFTVSKISSTAAENTVGYLVIAGGGAGAHSYAGGGGAGGYREGRNVPIDNFTASPLVANAPTNAVTVTSQAYPITVGAGGTGPSSPGDAPNGNPSIFSTITSAGGGGGGVNQPDTAPSGGSGGGGGGDGGAGVPLGNGGAGNTPPVSPPQGQNGGNGQAQGGYGGAGGGGGAGGAGVNATNTVAGAGGNGVSSSITGASVARGGGGGGGIVCQPDSQGGNPGPGGGGKGGGGGAANPTGTAGTVNTGGGGGAGGNSPSSDDGLNGGSGIVIIRYKFQ